jgi:hypothetical protein
MRTTELMPETNPIPNRPALLTTSTLTTQKKKRTFIKEQKRASIPASNNPAHLKETPSHKQPLEG